jgi:hypothetical protein
MGLEGDRVEEAGIALSIKPLGGLAEVQEPGRSRGEAGGGGGLGAMTVRLMILAVILLALGGCQNPGRFQAGWADTAAVD